jgi:hypothetical protein
MQRKIFLLPSFLIAILISTGCSTTQVTFNKAKPVDSEKIYDKSFLNPDENNEKISVIRDQGFLGSACTHTIFINNKKVFDIEKGQAIMVSIEPGNHVLRLESGVGICPDTSLSESTFLKIGEPQTFRISISSNGQIMLSRIK